MGDETVNLFDLWFIRIISQQTFTCSKWTVEKLEKCKKYVRNTKSFWCLLIYFTSFSTFAIVKFEQVNVCWDVVYFKFIFTGHGILAIRWSQWTNKCQRSECVPYRHHKMSLRGLLKTRALSQYYLMFLFPTLNMKLGFGSVLFVWAQIPFQNPLQTSVKLWFSNLLRGYSKGTSTWCGLKRYSYINQNLVKPCGEEGIGTYMFKPTLSVDLVL